MPLRVMRVALVRVAPCLSLIVHVVSPVNETPVFLFKPGPIRWKLWIEALSSTLIL